MNTNATNNETKNAFAKNDAVSVHFIVINSWSKATPVLMIPGMTNSADEYAQALQNYTHRPLICMSLRGRGHSDSPVSGYSYHDQLSDVLAVIDKINLKRFVIFGHSVGAAFAIGAALKHPDKVCGLVLGDYPPVYPAPGPDWVKKVLAGDANITPHAVEHLAHDAEQLVFTKQLCDLQMPTLVLRGGRDGSLLPEKIEQFYSKSLPNCQTQVLKNTAHDFFGETQSEFEEALESFVDKL